MTRRVALTIAGSDSGGGAGIAADLKSFEAHGVWGTAAITAVTAQNTNGVQAWEPVSPELVRAQIASVVADFDVGAAKTGMLATPEIVAVVAEADLPALVVDPVLAATTGDALAVPDLIDALRSKLLPIATVITPNLPEAAALAGIDEPHDRRGVEDVAKRLADLGPEVVLVTGGHLSGDESPDCLVVGGHQPEWLEGARIEGGPFHGSGCVLSAAICAELALGMEPADACIAGKRYVEQQMRAGTAFLRDMRHG